MTAARPRGFIAPLAIIALALLALAALMSLGVLSPIRRDGRAVLERARFEREAATLEARALHLLATEPLSARALLPGGDRQNPVEPRGAGAMMTGSGRRASILVLDDRPYAVSAGRARAYEVRLQDEAGLLNLNALDEQSVAHLLEMAEVDAIEARTLSATLADYVDKDGLRRLDGAEADDYARAGALNAPRNAALRSTRGALAALGWAQALTPPQARAFFAQVSANTIGRKLNLNTASAAVLQAVLNIDSRLARTMVDLRGERPFQSAEEAYQRAGVPRPAGELPIGAAPSGEIRLTIVERTGGRGARVYQSWLARTSQGADRPVVTHAAGGALAANTPAAAPSGDGRIDDFPQSPLLLAP
jgi:DNA uptake protein ComE-like DNA-binding protein